MDKPFKYLLVLLTLLCSGTSLYATHAAGGELIYERVVGTPDRYLFTFKFYRDCNPGSVAAPETVKMCYANQCGVQNLSVLLRKINGTLPDGRRNGSPVTTGCMSLPTTCERGTLAGYQEWWYTAEVTLPSACDYWRFWISISARNLAITNLQNAGQQNIYIEAMLNNTVSWENSSAYFSSAPIPYCCIGYPFVYDNGAIDPDGDSLVFESIRARSGTRNNDNCVSAPTNIPYTSPAFNPINNPFATNNSFSVNPETGMVAFTPAIQQVVVITIKVSEYRNGLLIGYVIRDIQIVVSACNTPLTSFAIDPTTVQGAVYQQNALTLMSCAGRELRFCYDITTQAPSAELIPSDDHLLSIPNASVTYTNVRTDSTRGCVVWATTPADVGMHELRISVRDSSCLPPGFIPTTTYTVPIIISDYLPVYDTVARTICANGAYLGHTVAGVYTDTLTSHIGCDSIHTLYLSVDPIFEHDVADTICRNRLPYQLGSQMIYTPGIHSELFTTTSTGCDSTVRLALAVIQPTDSTWRTQICRGRSYEGYHTPGVYTDVFTNAVGCDSTRTIHLSWLPYEDTVIHQEICHDESFLGYSNPGIYRDTFTDRYGCDSVRIVHLTVHSLTRETISRTICPGDVYLGYAQEGTYVDTLVSSTGCDSVRTLHLSHSPVLYQTVEAVICEGMSYEGYIATGTYVDTFVSAFQCDSIRTLQLTVRRLPDTNIRMSICAGADVFGYTTSGYYEDVFPSYWGCDSTRRLTLTVHPVHRVDTIVYICEGAEYIAGGAIRKEPGVFADSFQTASGCDSVWVTELRTTKRVIPDLGSDVMLCAGDELELYPGVFGYYSWSTGEITPRIRVKETGNYIVQVHDYAGCDGTDTVYVQVFDSPDVQIWHDDTLICVGDTIVLSAAGDLDFRWFQDGTPAGVGSHYVVTSQEYRNQTRIDLIGTDSRGCFAQDSLDLHPVVCCDPLFVPDAFTPNGDGLNDQFRVITFASFKDYKLMIMDRWGNVIFESADPQAGWNGTRLNVPADPGVYFYLLRTRCYESDKATVVKGSVTLIR